MNTNYILWVQEGKKKQVVYDFINHVGLDYMSKVKAISADLNSDFAEAFKERCSHLYNDVKQKIYDISKSKSYGIIAMETNKDHIHILICYDTTDRVCDIVKLIKQETIYYLWQKYPNFLSKCYLKHKIFWSD
jgi:hypothetical protein